MKQKVLLAGSTGYLGRYIAKELIRKAFPTRLIVRNKAKANFNEQLCEVIEAEVTKPETLERVCEGMDVVISTIGITRQRDDLTYMDVDYQANKNLLEAAMKAGVKRFVYIGVFNGEKIRHTKLVGAKEKFVDALQASEIDSVVIRPNGFFSDMEEFLTLAETHGRIYLFGDGEFKLNPIHGADLAEVCVQAICSTQKVIEVGGPEILTQNEIAVLAFEACNKRIKIRRSYDWLRKLALLLMRYLTSVKFYGPIEFFLTAMAMDNIAPTYGTRTLKAHFEEKANA